MKPMHRHPCALLLTVVLGGCIPFPHNQQESPALSGVLLYDGVPKADVTVRLVVNGNSTPEGCPADATTTKTDKDGKFSFASTKYFSAVIMMGDRFDAWRVCFEKPDGKQAIWQGGGPWGGPPAQELRCEIQSTDESAKDICSATDRR